MSGGCRWKFCTLKANDGPVRGGVQPGTPDGAPVHLAAVEMGKCADLRGVVLRHPCLSAVLGHSLPSFAPLSASAALLWPQQMKSPSDFLSISTTMWRTALGQFESGAYGGNAGQTIADLRRARLRTLRQERRRGPRLRSPGDDRGACVHRGARPFRADDDRSRHDHARHGWQRTSALAREAEVHGARHHHYRIYVRLCHARQDPRS